MVENPNFFDIIDKTPDSNEANVGLPWILVKPEIEAARMGINVSLAEAALRYWSENPFDFDSIDEAFAGLVQASREDSDLNKTDSYTLR